VAESRPVIYASGVSETERRARVQIEDAEEVIEAEPAKIPRESLAPPMTALRPATSGAIVYATAAGALSAVPVPLLDGMLASVARGSAVRRVAARRGVRISRGARSVLAGVGLTRATGTGSARFLRAALSRALAPIRIASRLESGVASFLTVVLFDHYLRTSDRRAGMPVDELEAERIRRAMESAFAESGLEALKTMPLGAVDLVARSVRAAASVDTEDRGIVERLVDSLLDGLADAPTDAVERLTELFDAALARGE
jgi:hypothetical protein